MADKLSTLLSGEDIISSLIDPEGIITGARLARASINRENSSWSARYVFPAGETLILVGVFHESIIPIIQNVKFQVPGEKYIDVPSVASETLRGALSRLDEVPVRLRQIMSPRGSKKAGNEKFSLKSYLTLIDEAVMWGVETRAEGLEGFVHYTVTFREEVGKRKVEFRLSADMPEGEIALQCDATEAGLGNKKAVIRKNLGMKRSVTAECSTRKDRKNIPSLKAAFDLYGRIPVLYSKERRKKKTVKA